MTKTATACFRFTASLLLGSAICTSGQAWSQDIVRPIGRFVPEKTENLDKVIKLGSFLINDTIDVFQGDVTFRSLVPPPNNTTIHLWGGSCLGNDCANPRSGAFLIGATTGQEIVFNIPVVRFGAFFTNTSGSDDAVAKFYDPAGVLLDTEIVPIPVAGRGWTWNGWESDVPLGRIELRGNGFLEGFLWLDDMSLDQEAQAACSTRNGAGANPVGFFCVTRPLVGATWFAAVDTTPSVGQSTLATAVVTGLGGPTNGAFFPSGEALLLPPYRVDLSLGANVGNHGIGVPPDASLSGREVYTQAARWEASGTGTQLVLLNGLDLVLGRP